VAGCIGSSVKLLTIGKDKPNGLPYPLHRPRSSAESKSAASSRA
jgi:hypothetical protein